MTTFVCLDIETTGLLKPEHRIIEFYASMHDLDTFEVVSVLETRIDPERGIGAESQRVHGISSTDLVGQPKWPTVAPVIASFVRDAAFIVAHNGEGFDGPFLAQEFVRIGMPPLRVPIYDTMLLGRWATPDGRAPNLRALCFACGVHYDTRRAHAASYDVQVLLECFRLGVRWGAFKLPTELARAA